MSNLSLRANLSPIKGIRIGITQAGIRYPNRDDLVLIEINPTATVAGVFTQNSFCAAPVQVCRKHLSQNTPRALIINTGNANAATGEAGVIDALACSAGVAELLQIEATQVLPFSTGVIGEPLPLKALIKGLAPVFSDLDENNWERAAAAIMTTDTRPKYATRTFEINGGQVNLTGIAKGSGMIQPNMATMLGFIATDALIEPALLDEFLKSANQLSFNCITVDSDTSTNDSVILIATGCGEVQIDKSNQELFFSQLSELMIELAQAIVKDGEGATKFISVNIHEGKDIDECRLAGFAIANSPLIKTALFASDPNWGRIVMAIGKAGLSKLNQNIVNIDINNIRIVTNGCRDQNYNEELAANALQDPNIVIDVFLARGSAQATIWTCDFSYEYVKINADYRS